MPHLRYFYYFCIRNVFICIAFDTLDIHILNI